MKWYAKILYAPIGWALHLLALMPWWVLYLNADVLYFIAYHLVGYRKKVVRQNISSINKLLRYTKGFRIPIILSFVLMFAYAVVFRTKKKA